MCCSTSSFPGGAAQERDAVLTGGRLPPRRQWLVGLARERVEPTRATLRRRIAGDRSRIRTGDLRADARIRAPTRVAAGGQVGHRALARWRGTGVRGRSPTRSMCASASFATRCATATRCPAESAASTSKGTSAIARASGRLRILATEPPRQASGCGSILGRIIPRPVVKMLNRRVMKGSMDDLQRFYAARGEP